MKDSFFNSLKNKGIALPDDVLSILKECKSYRIIHSVDELVDAAHGGKNSSAFEVKYMIPGKEEYTEATVHRVSNGVAVNYTDAYMRRRDPETMYIADDKPTDKKRFEQKFGYDFSELKQATFDWLKDQNLALFFYFVGLKDIGITGIAICPANAGFFALGLAMLQQFVPPKDLKDRTVIESVIYVAPTFRHTHFNGKQIVVHNRQDHLHEMYSYNLYPGPSAKKGLYGVLLTKGEKENWTTAHCSTVQVISPYDNTTTFMHEGASGGGKSEMLQNIVREPTGQVLIGENIITKERRLINLPVFCSFQPVTDDMALCHPSLQKDNGKLTVYDAENAWFIGLTA